MFVFKPSECHFITSQLLLWKSHNVIIFRFLIFGLFGLSFVNKCYFVGFNFFLNDFIFFTHFCDISMNNTITCCGFCVLLWLLTFEYRFDVGCDIDFAMHYSLFTSRLKSFIIFHHHIQYIKCMSILRLINIMFV